MGKVSTTIQVVDKASKRLNNIYQALNRVNKAFDKLGSKSGIDNVVKATQRANSKMRVVTASTQSFSTQLQKSAAQANSVAAGVSNIGAAAKSGYQPVNLLLGKLRRLASIYLGVLGTKAIAATADTLTSSQIRFESAGVDPVSTTNKVFNAAQASFADFGEMMGNVGKSLTLARDAFGNTTEEQVDNAIKFQEIMAKTYALSGASQAEMNSSMYQLIQALNSGNLQGDELRSVREGAPMAAKAIEKYAQAVYGTTDSLKEMGSQGIISSKMVVEAILDMEAQTEEGFARVRESMTFAQAFTQMKNETVRAFQPFLQTITEISNSRAVIDIIGTITKLIYGVGNALNFVAQTSGQVINFMRENWGTIGPIFYGLISVVTTFALLTLGRTLVGAVITATKYILGLIAALTSTQVAFLGIAAFIGLTVYYFTALGVSANTLAKYIGTLSGVLLVAAAISMVTGATLLGMTAPVLLVVGAVLALIAVFTAFPGEVGGAVGIVLGVLANFGIGAFNIFASVANFLHNVFRKPIASVIGLFGDMGSNVLEIVYSMVSGIEGLINMIPGVEVDLTSGLRGFIDRYKETVNGVKDKAGWETLIETKDFIDIGAAQGAGANAATSVHDWLGNIGTNIGDSIGGLFDASRPPEFAQVHPFDTSILDALGDIEDNTGKTAKNTQLTDEDLRYLRDVAEREAINRWTAAQIHIDMQNNNNVHNINDLDGIAIGLRGILLEELDSMATGWHDA